MNRLPPKYEAIIAVFVTGALEALLSGNQFLTWKDAARTAIIGGLGGILYWMRSPKDRSDLPPRQDPPKD